MIDDSPHQPAPGGPESGQEKWISRAEILKEFPVTDSMLKYWRRYKKVRFETKRNVTYYVESDIREMVERQSRAKKRIRNQWVKKKLATIHFMVGILVISAGICFVYFMDPFDENTLTKFQVFLPFMAIFIFAFIYWTVRLIQYLWKISFRKNNTNK